MAHARHDSFGGRDWLLWPLLDSLASEALLREDVPRGVADVARRAAGARFAHLASSVLDRQSEQRVAAYFWGVVRRRAVRHAPGYAQRIVRASLAADLRQAGWDADSIQCELERSA